EIERAPARAAGQPRPPAVEAAPLREGADRVVEPGNLLDAAHAGYAISHARAARTGGCVHRQPRAGIPEDPVIGSAHCCLGPYWAGRLGRTALTGYQASPRGGLVRVRLAGDRVILGGHAVTVLQGELMA